MRKGVKDISNIDPSSLNGKSLFGQLGNPPYEFLSWKGDANIDKLSANLPQKIIKNNRVLNTRLSPTKSLKVPGPNWVNINSQLISKNGFQFQLAPESIQSSKLTNYTNAEGQRANDKFDNVLNYNSSSNRDPRDFSIDKAVFWFKSKRSKKFMDIPKRGDRFDMMTIQNQIGCTATVDSCYVDGRRKSGYIVLRDFKTSGPVKNPSEYS